MKSLTLLEICAAILFFMACGTAKRVPTRATVAKVLETQFVTTDNDTIPAYHRILWNLKEGGEYLLVIKEGKCVNIRKFYKPKS